MMNELDIKPIYDIWPTSFWRTSIGYGLLFMLLVLLITIIGGILYVWRTRHNNLPPRERALRDLNKLLSQTSQSQAQYVYQELTNTLKRYIAWVLKLPTDHMTDWELFNHIKVVAKDDQWEQAIKNAQAVKFAHFQIADQQIRTDIQQVIQFVEQTSDIQIP